MLIKSIALVAATVAIASTSFAQDMRTIDSTWGETEVPVSPQRVYTDGPWTFGNAIALGVTPVATGTYGEGDLEYLGDAALGAVAIPIGDNGVSMETIAGHSPDLIVIRGWLGEWNDERCKLAINVASVYCYEQNKDSLEGAYSNLTKLAAALNKSDEADALIAAMDDRIAALKARVEAVGLDERTISIVRIFSDKYKFASGLETIMFRAVGLSVPASEVRPDPEPEDFSWSIFEFSLENLDIVQSDIVFLETDKDNNGRLDELMSNPLYPTLPAVENNQIFHVETGIWNSFDFFSLNIMLDQIEEFVIIPAEQAN